MRIVSGIHKGKRILAPRNLPSRPTTDMAKEALFNILNNRFYFEDMTVLDLYSGIGSISLEFASRGCTDIIAIDNHGGCVRFLRETSERLDASISCIKSDALTFLDQTERKFDFIFADPPYDMDMDSYERLNKTVFDRALLKEDGVLCIEHQSNLDLSVMPHFEQSRKYGGSTFSFFSIPANS